MIGPLDDQIQALTGVSATRIRWVLAAVAFVGIILVLGFRLFGR
jgi:hypothetical protein